MPYVHPANCQDSVLQSPPDCPSRARCCACNLWAAAKSLHKPGHQQHMHSQATSSICIHRPPAAYALTGHQQHMHPQATSSICIHRPPAAYAFRERSLTTDHRVGPSLCAPLQVGKEADSGATIARKDVRGDVVLWCVQCSPLPRADTLGQTQQQPPPRSQQQATRLAPRSALSEPFT